MTGADHKAAAERLVAEYQSRSQGGHAITPPALTIAQIHATLAVEAAIRAVEAAIRGEP